MAEHQSGAGSAVARSGKVGKHKFKVVLLGESAVGKSSIVTRLTHDEFNQYKESTIGAAFMKKDIVLDASRTVSLEIWDTAGQERYKSLAPMYYRNAHAAVVVYDITQEASFDRAKSWIKELQRQADSNITIALAGNKTDLADRRTVAKEEGAAYAATAGLLFFETSAQSGENVGELFVGLAKKIPWPAESAPSTAGARTTVNLQAAGRSDGSAAQDNCAC